MNYFESLRISHQYSRQLQRFQLAGNAAAKKECPQDSSKLDILNKSTNNQVSCKQYQQQQQQQLQNQQQHDNSIITYNSNLNTSRISNYQASRSQTSLSPLGNNSNQRKSKRVEQRTPQKYQPQPQGHQTCNQKWFTKKSDNVNNVQSYFRQNQPYSGSFVPLQRSPIQSNRPPSPLSQIIPTQNCSGCKARRAEYYLMNLNSISKQYFCSICIVQSTPSRKVPQSEEVVQESPNFINPYNRHPEQQQRTIDFQLEGGSSADMKIRSILLINESISTSQDHNPKLTFEASSRHYPFSPSGNLSQNSELFFTAVENSQNPFNYAVSQVQLPIPMISTSDLAPVGWSVQDTGLAFQQPQLIIQESEPPLQDQIHQKKIRLDSFSEDLFEGLGKTQGSMQKLRERRNEVARFYANQEVKLQDNVKMMVRSIQQELASSIEKVREAQQTTMQTFLAKEAQLTKILFELQSTQDDVQKNRQQIITAMEEQPFNAIIDLYQQNLLTHLGTLSSLGSQPLELSKTYLLSEKNLQNEEFSEYLRQIMVVQQKRTTLFGTHSFVSETSTPQRSHSTSEATQLDQSCEPNVFKNIIIPAKQQRTVSSTVAISFDNIGYLDLPIPEREQPQQPLQHFPVVPFVVPATSGQQQQQDFTPLKFPPTQSHLQSEKSSFKTLHHPQTPQVKYEDAFESSQSRMFTTAPLNLNRAQRSLNFEENEECQIDESHLSNIPMHSISDEQQPHDNYDYQGQVVQSPQNLWKNEHHFNGSPSFQRQDNDCQMQTQHMNHSASNLEQFNNQPPKTAAAEELRHSSQFKAGSNQQISLENIQSSQNQQRGFSQSKLLDDDQYVIQVSQGNVVISCEGGELEEADNSKMDVFFSIEQALQLKMLQQQFSAERGGLTADDDSYLQSDVNSDLDYQPINNLSLSEQPQSQGQPQPQQLLLQSHDGLLMGNNSQYSVSEATESGSEPKQLKYFEIIQKIHENYSRVHSLNHRNSEHANPLNSDATLEYSCNKTDLRLEFVPAVFVSDINPSSTIDRPEVTAQQDNNLFERTHQDFTSFSPQSVPLPIHITASNPANDSSGDGDNSDRSMPHFSRQPLNQSSEKDILRQFNKSLNQQINKDTLVNDSDSDIVTSEQSQSFKGSSEVPINYSEQWISQSRNDEYEDLYPQINKIPWINQYQQLQDNGNSQLIALQQQKASPRFKQDIQERQIRTPNENIDVDDNLSDASLSEEEGVSAF